MFLVLLGYFLAGVYILLGIFLIRAGRQTKLPHLPFTRSLSQPSSRVFSDHGAASLRAQSEKQRFRLLTETRGQGVRDQWPGVSGQNAEVNCFYFAF